MKSDSVQLILLTNTFQSLSTLGMPEVTPVCFFPHYFYLTKACFTLVKLPNEFVNKADESLLSLWTTTLKLHIITWLIVNIKKILRATTFNLSNSKHYDEVKIVLMVKWDQYWLLEEDLRSLMVAI